MQEEITWNEDYENIYDLDDLDDAELRRIVQETLKEKIGRSILPIHHGARARGEVILAGRVGTDAERPDPPSGSVEDRIGIHELPGAS